MNKIFEITEEDKKYLNDIQCAFEMLNNASSHFRNRHNQMCSCIGNKDFNNSEDYKTGVIGNLFTKIEKILKDNSDVVYTTVHIEKM